MRSSRISTFIIILGKIVTWILGIAVIIMIFLKLTDHSPTLDQIMISMLGAMFATMLTFGYVFGTHMGGVSRFMREFDRWRKDSDRRFYALAKDLAEFKNHTH